MAFCNLIKINALTLRVGKYFAATSGATSVHIMPKTAASIDLPLCTSPVVGKSVGTTPGVGARYP